MENEIKITILDDHDKIEDHGAVNKRSANDKLCKNCDKTKNRFEDFHTFSQHGIKSFSSLCKDCHKERLRDYYHFKKGNNPGYKEKWGKKEYAAKPLIEGKEYHKDTLRKRKSRQSKIGREKNAEYTKKRRERITSSLCERSAEITPEWFENTIKMQGEKCIYCGARERLFMEHMTPISRGGLHHPDNIVAACGSCNSTKRAKTLREFISAPMIFREN